MHKTASNGYFSMTIMSPQESIIEASEAFKVYQETLIPLSQETLRAHQHAPRGIFQGSGGPKIEQGHGTRFYQLSRVRGAKKFMENRHRNLHHMGNQPFWVIWAIIGR